MQQYVTKIMVNKSCIIIAYNLNNYKKNIFARLKYIVFILKPSSPIIINYDNLVTNNFSSSRIWLFLFKFFLGANP